MAEQKQQQTEETLQQSTMAAKSGLDTITSKINAMAGESGAVDLKLRDLFSGVFKKHTRKDSEEIFIAGTLQTTPEVSEIATSWPKPWLFSRILVALLISYGLLYVCVTEFGNTKALPGLMFIGALALPFSVLIFIFETNAPRNISIFEVMKMFFVGGTASLVLTLFLFQIFTFEQLDYAGALTVGFVEEMGKLLAIVIFVKILNPRYILNGMLMGAAIGAGFAVFETAGYAFEFYLFFQFKMDILTKILFSRGWSSLGGHVVWAAIIGAGLIMAKGDAPFSLSNLSNRKFQIFFFVPVILHAIWDCPFMRENEDRSNIKLIALIAIAWIFILVLLNVGLKQVERICADIGHQTDPVKKQPVEQVTEELQEQEAEEKFKLGDYTFDTRKEYERAARELKWIQTVTEKYDLQDVKTSKKLLLWVQSGKVTFHTPVGNMFVKELEEKCRVGSDVQSES